MCDPVLVTLLKMRPHDSQSSPENAAPSSGTSPLASCKVVPPPPGPVIKVYCIIRLSQRPFFTLRTDFLSFRRDLRFGLRLSSEFSKKTVLRLSSGIIGFGKNKATAATFYNILYHQFFVYVADMAKHT